MPADEFGVRLFWMTLAEGVMQVLATERERVLKARQRERMSAAELAARAQRGRSAKAAARREGLPPKKLEQLARQRERNRARRARQRAQAAAAVQSDQQPPRAASNAQSAEVSAPVRGRACECACEFVRVSGRRGSGPPPKENGRQFKEEERPPGRPAGSAWAILNSHTLAFSAGSSPLEAAVSSGGGQ